MTTKRVDCALELSHTLNFSRAAENLFISQPALTYQIQYLENEIGFRLFERTGKGADLTPAGARSCTELRRIRTELKAAVEQRQNMSSDLALPSNRANCQAYLKFPCSNPFNYVENYVILF